MKILQLLTLASLTIFFSFSCDTSEISSSNNVTQTVSENVIAKNISAKEFQSLISEDAIVLDV